MKNLYSSDLINNLKRKINNLTIIMISLTIVMISFDVFCFLKVNHQSKTLYTILSIVVTTLIIWIILSFLILIKYYKNNIIHYDEMLFQKYELVTGTIIKNNDIITLENNRKCHRITISIDNKEYDYYIEEFLYKNDLLKNDIYNLYVTNRYVIYYEKCN